MIHTVKFNRTVGWLDQVGIAFVNVTTGETVLPTALTPPPATIAEYEVPWLVNPVAGDVVEWRYDGTGTYVGSESINVASNFPLTHSLTDGVVDGSQASASFSRPAGPATVEDFEGVIHKVKDGEARFWKARRVENLYQGDSDVIDVLSFPVESGKYYQASVLADASATAIVSLNGQGFGGKAIVAQIEKRGGIGGGSVFATGTGNVILSVAVGNVSEILVEELNNNDFDANYSSEYVSTEIDYGANVSGVRYFSTDRSGGSLTDLRGCLVEEGDPAYDPNSGVQGTTQSETLDVPRPASLMVPELSFCKVLLETYTVSDDANASTNSTTLFINSQNNDNNLRLSNNSFGTYTFRKRVNGNSYDVNINDGNASKSRLHNFAMTGDGMVYRLNGVQVVNSSTDPVLNLDQGDGLIHLGTNDTGAVYQNAGFKNLIVYEAEYFEPQELELINCAD